MNKAQIILVLEKLFKYSCRSTVDCPLDFLDHTFLKDDVVSIILRDRREGMRNTRPSYNCVTAILKRVKADAGYSGSMITSIVPSGTAEVDGTMAFNFTVYFAEVTGDTKPVEEDTSSEIQYRVRNDFRPNDQRITELVKETMTSDQDEGLSDAEIRDMIMHDKLDYNDLNEAALRRLWFGKDSAE